MYVTIDSAKVVLNETASRSLGFKNPQEAIGKSVSFFNEPGVFTVQGITGDFLLREEITRQVYLGTDGFISSLQEKRKNDGEISEIPAIQRNLSTLESFEKESADRNEAMARAFLSGLFTLRQIGEHFNVHYTTVSRVVKRFCNPELRRKRQDTDAFLKKSEVSLESKLK